MNMHKNKRYQTNSHENINYDKIKLLENDF